MMNLDFLVIEGNIGAGKTTFAKMLGEEYLVPAYPVVELSAAV